MNPTKNHQKFTHPSHEGEFTVNYFTLGKYAENSFNRYSTYTDMLEDYDEVEIYITTFEDIDLRLRMSECILVEDVKRPQNKGDKFTCWGIEGIYTVKYFRFENESFGYVVNYRNLDLSEGYDSKDVYIQAEGDMSIMRYIDCKLVEAEKTNSNTETENLRIENEALKTKIERLTDNENELYSKISQLESELKDKNNNTSQLVDEDYVNVCVELDEYKSTVNVLLRKLAEK